jgi:hypothetical protein
MKMKVLLALVAAAGILVAVPTTAVADSGNASPTLSFFSGGGGAHAGWVHTDDQPPGDTDQQAMQIFDTTDPNGYAGVLVHHVYGIPTATFPNSTFDFKSNLASPSSLGYPRLEILFSDGGDASLRPLTWQQTWSTVADPNWDNNHGGCGFLFEVSWQQIQNCHPGTFVTNAYITTDPGIDVMFLIDNLYVDGKRFSNAGDNSNGDNTTATFTPDLLSLLANPISG